MAGLTPTHPSSQWILFTPNLDEAAQMLSGIWLTLVKINVSTQSPCDRFASGRKTFRILAENTAQGCDNPALMERFFWLQAEGSI